LIEEAHIQYGNAPSQFGVLRVPKGDVRFPVVVTIHGGFWKWKYNLEDVIKQTFLQKKDDEETCLSEGCSCE